MALNAGSARAAPAHGERRARGRVGPLVRGGGGPPSPERVRDVAERARRRRGERDGREQPYAAAHPNRIPDSPRYLCPIFAESRRAE